MQGTSNHGAVIDTGYFHSGLSFWFLYLPVDSTSYTHIHTYILNKSWKGFCIISACLWTTYQVNKYTEMDLQVFSAQHLKPFVFCIADTTCSTDAVFPVPGIPET